MVIGTVRLHSEDFIGAEREFVAADQEHQKKHGRQSHVALDSIGYVAFQCRWRGFNNSEPASVDDQLTKAMKYFEKVLKVRPHYDSANYHLAQVEDERSRIVFRDMSTSNACAGLEHLTQAAGYYERLLQRNPNFAIAYEQYGTMLLQQYYFIRKNGSARCASDASLSSEGTQALFQKALDLFDKALALDPQLGQAWLQSGILVYQAQDPRLELGSSGAAESDVRRRVLLDDAISRLSNATEISPDNWYVWQRFAEANHARGCVSGGPSRLVYAKRTLRAYCRAADAIERDSNYAWRASEGQTALGTISRLAVCLSETRSGCSVPDPPASADFCHCLEIEPAP